MRPSEYLQEVIYYDWPNTVLDVLTEASKAVPGDERERGSQCPAANSPGRPASTRADKTPLRATRRTARHSPLLHKLNGKLRLRPVSSFIHLLFALTSSTRHISPTKWAICFFILFLFRDLVGGPRRIFGVMPDILG